MAADKNNSTKLVKYPLGSIFVEDNGGVAVVNAATFEIIGRNRKNHVNLTNAGAAFTLDMATTFLSDPDDTTYNVQPEIGDQIVLVVKEALTGALTITLGTGFYSGLASIALAADDVKIFTFEYGTFAGETAYFLTSQEVVG